MISMMPTPAVATTIIATISILFVSPTGTQANENLYRALSNDEAPQQARQHQQQQLQPGHYEFEVAPRMVPPEVRKPPYPPSAQHCPGSDLFGGFSPRDTLCGDLNQGRVPLNPLGQSVHDQSYPFELIKNKTLQFLARALPVLKLEYESIPKVARYLPPPQQHHHHLLNPTHQASALTQEHMELLNQRLGAGAFAPSQQDYLSSAYALRRRRKRSAASTSARQSGALVAELSPNATLVVSSAHSAPSQAIAASSSGRISWDPYHHHQLAVITKDGYKPVAAPALPATNNNNNNNNNNGAQQQQQTSRGRRPSVSASSSLSPSSSSRSGNNGADRQQQPQQQVAENGANHAAAKLAKLEQQHQQQQPHQTEANVVSSGDAQGRSSGDLQAAAAKPAQAQVAAASASAAQAAARQDGGGQRGLRKLVACPESGNGFTSAICQAAAALIEGERQPAWLQLARYLGTAYAGSQDAAQTGVWSLVSGLASAVAEANGVGGHEQPERSSAKTASSQPTAQARLLGLLRPLTSLLSSAASLSPRHDNPPAAPRKEALRLHPSAETTTASAGGGEHAAAGEGKVVSAESKAAQQEAADKKQQQGQLAASLATIGSSPMTKLALAGWASSAIAQMVEYFVPSLFSSISSSARTFARRKKPYDPQETFVDTPASAAYAMRRDASSTPTGISSQVKQPPPTPCPSSEEYVSPTFARNYQGAWKYVVQIPHEGYFTQTIQRTSCLRQRCEFTEGTCHESPRWVSLLVAEIYYPNTVFGNQQPALNTPASELQAATTGGQQQQQQLVAAPSTSSVVQQARPTNQQQHDPLQMTDTTYNHNLHNALITAANELGLDPSNVANMQNLANAYNYQLMQRQGQLAASTAYSAYQQPAIESRSSSSPAPAPQLADMSQQQQQYLQSVATSPTSEYITALAAATLQQNPNMSIQELLQSLNLAQLPAQSKRKKRDTGNQQQQQLRQRQQQQQHYLQQRSSPLETIPSLNDITSQVPQQQQQQQVPVVHQQSQQLNQQQQQQHPHQHQQQQQQQQQYKTQQAQQQTSPLDGQQQQQHQQQPSISANQAAQESSQECDGHDKLGCYVVRVYYDWFLVNGSCKCWKTAATGGSTTGSTNGGGNSFLRRIFTG